ncbi:EAL domain-containing protein [Vibrio sp. IRLE0018]|uniref:sensor domain-containing phosphodiesterase n=1 Tax=Vibrio floridensis TaxID=2908007 RepID=UPI001F2893A5|nr:sensor domain-containing phosphodiesterase [Vibrio floridensis]MCF8777728.1 EAL domain-containing protein [Vibrio floridensis]
MAIIDTSQLTVPESVINSWQEIVDLVAKMTQCPAALVMRIHETDIEVFSSSRSENNPYAQHAKDSLGHGLYCETVISERRMLNVPNALADPNWDSNPDIKLGMICYCGLPVFWPDNTPFGTICMLDNHERYFDEDSLSLLGRFQTAIEGQLDMLYRKEELAQLNQELEAKVAERTKTLADLSSRLLTEVEQRTAAETHLDFHLHYDPLTKLPNRITLADDLAKQIKKLSHDEQITLVYFSLKNFKFVNASYGYMFGDQILSSLSERLCHKLPKEWKLARIVGSDFVLSARHKRNQETQEEVIERVIKACTQPFMVNEMSVNLQCNLGIALAPMDATDSFSLMQRACSAMSVAKNQGLQASYFNVAAQKEAEERLLLESHLSDALKNQEMQVHFQPIICLKQGGKVIGAEALLRWKAAQLGAISPDRFIPLAESNGQIIEIGYFVLHQALKHAAEWRKLSSHSFKMAINISPIQFREPHFVQHLQDIIELYQLPPQCVELELTEGILLQDEEYAQEVLAQLRHYGVNISLDDFGTGYSSLSYLQKYAFDTLKIDRSFINQLEHKQHNRELTRAIIAMAHKLNMMVIAEGVENHFQEDFIRTEECNYAQGFLYGKAMPPAEFEDFLLNHEGF